MKVPVLSIVPRDVINTRTLLFSIDEYLRYVETEYTDFEMPCHKNRDKITMVNVRGFNMPLLSQVLTEHPVGFYRYISIAALFYGDLKPRVWRGDYPVIMIACDASAYAFQKYGYDVLNKAKDVTPRRTSINYKKLVTEFLRKYSQSQ